MLMWNSVLLQLYKLPQRSQVLIKLALRTKTKGLFPMYLLTKKAQAYNIQTQHRSFVNEKIASDIVLFR